MSGMLTQAQWVALIGQSFEIAFDGPPIIVRLAIVRSTDSSLNPSHEAFALEFSGPLDPLLPQGTYTFTHPEFGQFEVFIVPVARAKEGVTYEAVFN